jgi:hypothetical protein
MSQLMKLSIKELKKRAFYIKLVKKKKKKILKKGTGKIKREKLIFTCPEVLEGG